MYRLKGWVERWVCHGDISYPLMNTEMLSVGVHLIYLRLYTVGSNAMMKCEKRKWQSLSYRMATILEMKKKWTCQHFNAYLMHKQYVLMSETLGFAQQTHPLTEAGGYLVDVLSLHTPS